MNLLITGGTGFFGRSLLRKLSCLFEQGLSPYSSIIVLTRKNSQGFLDIYPEFLNKSWLRFYRGDVLDPHTLPIHEKIDHILHAATDAVTQVSLLNRYDQIVCGTRNILDFALKKNISRFLFISSGAVYGSYTKEGGIPEEWHCIPNPFDISSIYGLAKRAAEELCFLYSKEYELFTIIARCFTFVGQDLPRNAHFAIGNFINDALYSEYIDVCSNGKALRSYLSQDDLAEWLLSLLRKGQKQEAYNVGSDQVLTISAVAQIVRDIFAPNKQVRILGNNNIGNDSKYTPDISKIKRDIGVKINISLQDALHTIKNTLS